MRLFNIAILAIAAMVYGTAAANPCGPGFGSCGEGECCSEFGYCGTTQEYCSGGCQLLYSHACNTQIPPAGGSTEDVSRRFVGDVPYAATITDCTTPGVVALTFDDGPYTFTNDLLDILDDYGVKATFFITGNNRGKGSIDNEDLPWPDVLRRMHSARHQLASHTWTHRNLSGVDMETQRTEMIYNEMAFRNIFGFFPTYMRPPFLECSLRTGCIETLESLGYHIISTNLDTKDYENDSPLLIEISKQRFFTQQSPDKASHEYIVLAHDVHQQTVVTLTKYMIQTSKERGYKLVTVGECLNDPPENWYRSA
ncbi:putative peptidoglycan-N-acetylglucosamine deacetylase [Trichoderma ghanense]|uniref:Peptidoglycan-N-acetylglucosamine deacetylase n=1 Tax=Trichoderma ghanense TaxID=65468 RepID=A0ABY2GR50_9HYPO